jgi:sugar phosphate isomerase/epimerase
MSPTPAPMASGRKEGGPAPTALTPGAAAAAPAGAGSAEPTAAGTDAMEPAPAESNAPGQRHLDAIGIQLYTLRGPMQQDFEGTLRSLASMGYREVEFAGLFGHDPAEVRQLLAALNLSAVGSHVDWNRIRDDSAGAIAEALALGSHYLVFPFLPDSERQTLAQWQNWVVVLNQVGASCRAAGLELAYHNHDFEFADVEGVVPYDLLLEQLDHELVKMELDLFWLAKGGRDPAALFAAYPGAFPLVHVKDMRLSDGAMVDVGQGNLNFAAIFAQSELAGTEHYIVEHDMPAEAIQTARNSLTYLENLTF